MRKKILTYELEVPEDVSITWHNNHLIVKGPKGEVSRDFRAYKVSIKHEGTKLSLSSEKPSKREKMMLGTFYAHMQNMITGVKKGYIYKLKVSSGHFPMSVAVKNDIFEIKNFFGERKPRTAKIIKGIHVKVEGEIITVSGVNLEEVSQTAANIEQATRISGRDKRVFMDRINIISKDEI